MRGRQGGEEEDTEEEEDDGACARQATDAKIQYPAIDTIAHHSCGKQVHKHPPPLATSHPHRFPNNGRRVHCVWDEDSG